MANTIRDGRLLLLLVRFLALGIPRVWDGNVFWKVNVYFGAAPAFFSLAGFLTPRPLARLLPSAAAPAGPPPGFLPFSADEVTVSIPVPVGGPAA